jgi:hypothetical protein
MPYPTPLLTTPPATQSLQPTRSYACPPSYHTRPAPTPPTPTDSSAHIWTAAYVVAQAATQPGEYVINMTIGGKDIEGKGEGAHPGG